jgi:hypothetical protein
MLAVRKRYRILVLAAMAAAIVVPVGFALSLESNQLTVSPQPVVAVSVIAGQTLPEPAQSSSRRSLPDAARLLGVGIALLGAAAAVRKAA